MRDAKSHPCGEPDIKAPTAALMLSGRRISGGNLGHSPQISRDTPDALGAPILISVLDRLKGVKNLLLRQRWQAGLGTTCLHVGDDVCTRAADRHIQI